MKELGAGSCMESRPGVTRADCKTLRASTPKCPPSYPGSQRSLSSKRRDEVKLKSTEMHSYWFEVVNKDDFIMVQEHYMLIFSTWCIGIWL